MLYTGLTTTTALNSMLLQSAQPALILMIGALMMKDRTGLRQIVGVVISLAGVLTVVSRGDPGVLLGLELNRGDAVLAAAMLLWAFYSGLRRCRPAVHPPSFLRGDTGRAAWRE